MFKDTKTKITLRVLDIEDITFKGKEISIRQIRKKIELIDLGNPNVIDFIPGSKILTGMISIYTKGDDDLLVLANPFEIYIETNSLNILLKECFLVHYDWNQFYNIVDIQFTTQEIEILENKKRMETYLSQKEIIDLLLCGEKK